MRSLDCDIIVSLFQGAEFQLKARNVHANLHITYFYMDQQFEVV